MGFREWYCLETTRTSSWGIRFTRPCSLFLIRRKSIKVLRCVYLTFIGVLVAILFVQPHALHTFWLCVYTYAQEYT